jgi:hypothetical protein
LDFHSIHKKDHRQSLQKLATVFRAFSLSRPPTDRFASCVLASMSFSLLASTCSEQLPGSISSPVSLSIATASLQRSRLAHSRMLWILLCLEKATRFSPVNRQLFESCAAH